MYCPACCGGRGRLAQSGAPDLKLGLINLYYYKMRASRARVRAPPERPLPLGRSHDRLIGGRLSGGIVR